MFSCVMCPHHHQGVLMPIVGFVGLVGNLLSVAVLSAQVRLSIFPRKFLLAGDDQLVQQPADHPHHLRHHLHRLHAV